MASTTENQVPSTAESRKQQAFVETGNLVTLADVKDTAIEVVKTAVQDKLEKTKAIVVEGASAVGQFLATGVDISLLKTEELVDYYLPMTKEELAKVSTPIEDSDTATVQEQSYYVRLGSLSSKARNRAYEYSIVRMQKAKENGQETLSCLYNLVDLIEMTKQGAESTPGKLQEIQAKLNQILLNWGQHQLGDQAEVELSEKTEHLESQSLAMTQNFSDQLQTICRTLASNVRGLPQSIEDQMQHVSKLAEEIYGSLSSATAFQDLSTQFLTQSKEQMQKIQEAMDGVMDYLCHNTPLNWLVGPFIPQLTENQEAVVNLK